MSLENLSSQETVEKSPFGEQFGVLEEAENFPNSKIISFKDGEGMKHYALSRDSQGNLKGSEFELQEFALYTQDGDGAWKNSPSRVDASGTYSVNGKDIPKYRIGPTYQMHRDKLDQMESFLKERDITI